MNISSQQDTRRPYEAKFPLSHTSFFRHLDITPGLDAASDIRGARLCRRPCKAQIRSHRLLCTWFVPLATLLLFCPVL